MPIDIKSMKPPGTGKGKTAGQPGPIRPTGVSSRLPLLLFIAVLAGLFIGYRYLTDSGAFRMAETFVSQNAEIRNAVGEVRTCRLWIPFGVDFLDDTLKVRLTLTLLVEGAKADTQVRVVLIREGDRWRIAAASYGDGRGGIRQLLQKPATQKGGEPTGLLPHGER